MAWTDADLAEIEKAIKSGAKRVKYQDKEIEYQSLAEMLQARDLIRVELGKVSRTRRVFANFSKGLKE